MSTPVPPVTQPDASSQMCPGDQRGPCAECTRLTHKYGDGGGPLCDVCLAVAQERWGRPVKRPTTPG